MLYLLLVLGCGWLMVGRALYLRNDPYETSDAVFGVKDSLVVDLGKAGPEYAKKYGVSEDHALLTYDCLGFGCRDQRFARAEL